MTLEDDIRMHLAGYEERKRLAIEREKILDERDAAIHKSILDLTEKMEQTIITVRDSTPASLSKILQTLQEKSDSNGKKLDEVKKQQNELKIQTKPIVDAVNVSGKLRTGVIWIAAPLISISGMVAAIIYLKNTFK